MKSKSQKIVACALLTVLIAVGAFLRIPLPLPITFQLFFVVLGALLLGGRAGAVSSVLYMVIGLIGVPVFTQGGGIGYVLQPSFGYIIGFIPAALIVGLIAGRSKNLSFTRALLASFAGMLVVYIIGTAYYYLIFRFVSGVELGAWVLFTRCFLLVAPGDILLCLVAATLCGRLKHLLPF